MTKGIRLSEHDTNAISNAFRQCFPHEDHLWIFGSRVDMSKRGGDIDLYIETTLTDISKITDAHYAFASTLEQYLGEQKIDIVIKYGDKDLPIYTIARNTGIQLI